jgi:ankyrin repeat protein
MEGSIEANACNLISAIQAPPTWGSSHLIDNLPSQFVDSESLSHCNIAEITAKVGSDQYSAMHWAAHCDEPFMLRAMVQKCCAESSKFSIDSIRNKSGSTALHVSCSRGASLFFASHISRMSLHDQNTSFLRWRLFSQGRYELPRCCSAMAVSADTPPTLAV